MAGPEPRPVPNLLGDAVRATQELVPKEIAPCPMKGPMPHLTRNALFMVRLTTTPASFHERVIAPSS